MNRTERKRQQQLAFFLNLGEGPFRYERQLLTGNFPVLERILGGKPVPAPLFVEIHPSGSCNNQCRWCRGASGGKTPDFAPSMLPEAVLLRLVNEFRERGVVRILFDGYYGEPLLNPATVTAMSRALDSELQVGLGTNGLLLDHSVQKVAVEATYVRVSLDVGSNEMHNRLKGTAGAPFDKIIENLSGLVALKRSRASAVRIGVSYLLQPENIEEIPIVTDRLAVVGVDSVQFKLTLGDPEGRLSEGQLDTAYRHIEAARERFDGTGTRITAMQSKAEAAREISASTAPDYDTCYAHHLMAVIGPDGNLYPCCEHSDRPRESLGSIMDRSFSEAWTGAGRTRVMESLRPCRSCPFCSRYNHRINKFLTFLAREQANDPGFLAYLKSLATTLNRQGEGCHLWESTQPSSPQGERREDAPPVTGVKRHS